MKKYITSILITVKLLAPPMVFAAGSTTAISTTQVNLISIAKNVGINLTGEGGNDVAIVVGGIIQTLLGVLGVVFLALTVYGGWLWMTAAGNQERVDQSKKLLRDSVIGLIIVITAYAITLFITGEIIQRTVAP